MAAAKNLSLLLVEDDLEDEMLIREALMEIEEGRHWGNWSNSSLTHVDSFEDALECLRHEKYDINLLNLTLPDAPSLLETFMCFQEHSDSPMLVLADNDDPILATHLIREGAQDVIVKSEIEPKPLARSIRSAIERSRRISATESFAMLDSLTGVYNRKGFAHLADHYLRMARADGKTAYLARITLGGQRSPAKTDLQLMRLSEASRALFPNTTLIGRTHRYEIALLTVGCSQDSVEKLLTKLKEDSDACPADYSATVSLSEVANTGFDQA